MTLTVSKVAASSNAATWTPAVVIAVCALVFTVASFWWLNVRRGRLKAFESSTFSAYIAENEVRLVVPLMLYNTGAAPIVIQNFRMRFVDEPGSNTLFWVTTRQQVTPRKDDWQFPAVFSVSGRTAYQMFVEFKTPSLGFELKAREYPTAIEAKLGHKRKWHKILKLPLRVSRIIEPNHYITYENAPDDLSEKERETVQVGLDMARLGMSNTDNRSVDMPTVNEPERGS